MRLGIIFFITFLLTIFLAGAMGQTVDLDLSHSAAAGGLCQKGEKLIFGCMTQNGYKISLCRSQILNKHTGWLKYREGAGKSNITFEFPADKSKPHKLYTFEKQTRYQSEKVYVRFKQGGSIHELFQEDYVTRGNRIIKSGVRIKKGGTILENLCAVKPKGTLNSMEGDIPYGK